LKTLEDYGFAAVDNLPLALVDPLIALEVETGQRKIAVGLDVRTSGFSPQAVKRLAKNLVKRLSEGFKIVFIGAEHGVLMRRYNTTRRQHPLCEDFGLAEAITADIERMRSIEPFADIIIDSTHLAPVDLRRDLLGGLGLSDSEMIPVYLESFSYRHGLPDFADQVIDMRFAKNPHWVNSLREKTGLDEEVANLLSKDEAAETVLENFKQILDTTLSRMQEDGRPKLTLAFGCTGGKHRSVWAAEKIGDWLKARGHMVYIRHRELKR